MDIQILSESIGGNYQITQTFFYRRNMIIIRNRVSSEYKTLLRLLFRPRHYAEKALTSTWHGPFKREKYDIFCCFLFLRLSPRISPSSEKKLASNQLSNSKEKSIIRCRNGWREYHEKPYYKYTITNTIEYNIRVILHKNFDSLLRRPLLRVRISGRGARLFRRLSCAPSASKVSFSYNIFFFINCTLYCPLSPRICFYICVK